MFKLFQALNDPEKIRGARIFFPEFVVDRMLKTAKVIPFFKRIYFTIIVITVVISGELALWGL